MSILRMVSFVFVLACALILALPVRAQVLQGKPGAPSTLEFPDSRVLPTPTPPFTGEIQPNLIDSTPAWPSTIAPPKGAPNVLLILIDDAGFGSNSVFGVNRRAKLTPDRRPMLTPLSREVFGL